MTIEQFDMSQKLDADRARDVLAISDLWRQIPTDAEMVLDDAQDPETLRRLMAGLDYFVKRDDGLWVIGAVSVMMCGSGLAKIDSLAVKPEHQGKGHGRELARRAVVYCDEARCVEIVTRAMPAAQPIFSQLGFRTIEPEASSGDATMYLSLQ